MVEYIYNDKALCVKAGTMLCIGFQVNPEA
jgi:hypothetical protein